MCKVWRHKHLTATIKLRLFEAAVVSVLMYGSEAWTLDSKAKATLRGWCARCVSQLTGRDIQDECRDPTFELVGRLRARRLKSRWLGEVLRLHSESLVRRVVLHQCELATASGGYLEGSLFDDAPTSTHASPAELVELAHTQDWADLVSSIRPTRFNAMTCSPQGVLRYD